jgi:hypothetical protein
VLWNQAKLILDRVPGWQVAEVVQQGPKPNEVLLLLCELPVKLPVLFEFPILTEDPALVRRVDHQLGDVHGPEAMLEPLVRCAAVDEVRLPELINVAEALESGVIDDLDFAVRKTGELVDCEKRLVLEASATRGFTLIWEADDLGPFGRSRFWGWRGSLFAHCAFSISCPDRGCDAAAVAPQGGYISRKFREHDDPRFPETRLFAALSRQGVRSSPDTGADDLRHAGFS